MRKLIWCILVFNSFYGFSKIREFTISSVEKTVSVGEVLKIFVSVIHDEANKLYFPELDSTAGRFEFVTKEVFSTRLTDDSLLLDSVVYGIRTFELADSLPFYFEILEGELRSVRSDVIWVKVAGGVVKGKENQLIPNSDYVDIIFKSNRHLYISILILLAICFVLFMIYGIPKVYQIIKKKRFIKLHETFLEQEYDTSWELEGWETYVSKWRIDLSKSMDVNLSGYTFLQLKKELKSEEINQVIDKLQSYLYDPESISGLDEQDFNKLKEYTQKCFEIKLKEWNN